jgi:hypothetical protein
MAIEGMIDSLDHRPIAPGKSVIEALDNPVNRND